MSSSAVASAHHQTTTAPRGSEAAVLSKQNSINQQPPASGKLISCRVEFLDDTHVVFRISVSAVQGAPPLFAARMSLILARINLVALITVFAGKSPFPSLGFICIVLLLYFKVDCFASASTSASRTHTFLFAQVDVFCLKSDGWMIIR